MLPRRLRLSRTTFPKAGRGTRLSSLHFTLLYGPSSDGGCSVVISKKVAPRSVDRHRIKRKMLALMRPYCLSTRYLVAYAKKDARALSSRELRTELTDLLTHLP